MLKSVIYHKYSHTVHSHTVLFDLNFVDSDFLKNHSYNDLWKFFYCKALFLAVLHKSVRGLKKRQHYFKETLAKVTLTSDQNLTLLSINLFFHTYLIQNLNI